MIKARAASSPKQINAEDLQLVGCMFLSNPSFADWNKLV